MRTADYGCYAWVAFFNRYPPLIMAYLEEVNFMCYPFGTKPSSWAAAWHPKSVQ